MLKTLFGWSAAVVTTAVVGSVVQSQINLAAISALSQSISMSERLGTSLFDIRSFSPVLGALVALAFVLAWPVAGLVAKSRPERRRWLFPLAGFIAVLTALLLMNALLPVAVIAAARTAVGVLALSLCGALGGWVYLKVTAEQP
ncbi:MAG: hypothetical protein ACXIUM_10675 [Wenzhouxiangella sp.]